MSYIGVNPESYDNTVQGDGECVAFVRKCSGAPSSTTWTKGAPITENTPMYTAIATFNDQGRYPTNDTGQHAAIFVRKEGTTLIVWDQWAGQPVNSRPIRDKNGTGRWSNDASRFSVIA